MPNRPSSAAAAPAATPPLLSVLLCAVGTSFLWAALLPGVGRADAIGPAPAPIECPPGAYSDIENWGRHGQGAYCAPRLAPAAGGCREGHRAEIMGLSIRGILPAGGGHGAPPTPPTDENTLAQVEGPCDAPLGEAPIGELPTSSRIGLLGMGGPNIADAPIGCHPFWVWVPDPGVHCPPAPVVAEGATPLGVEPTSVDTVAAAAETPPPSEAPIATATSPAASTTPVPASASAASGCTCSLGRRSGSASVVARLLLVMIALTHRVRRRPRGAR